MGMYAYLVKHHVGWHDLIVVQLIWITDTLFYEPYAWKLLCKNNNSNFSDVHCIVVGQCSATQTYQGGIRCHISPILSWYHFHHFLLSTNVHPNQRWYICHRQHLST